MSMRPNAQQSMLPAYFVSEREKFLQQCEQMGMDMYAVADFIDQKCIVEKDVGTVCDHLQNPNYMNPLRAQGFQIAQPQQIIQQNFANSNPMMQKMAG